MVTIVVPAGNVREQKLLQLVADGENETLPLPERVNSTVTVIGGERNVAEMLSGPVIVNVHVGGPLQPTDGPLPPQPPNEWPASGVAVSVTLVPWTKVPTQFVPQLMAAGDEVTVPLPVLVMVML